MSEIISKEDLMESYIVTKDLEIKKFKDFSSYFNEMKKHKYSIDELDNNANFNALLDFGNAIASSVRIKILQLVLKVKHTCFCELESIFKIQKSTLNYHDIFFDMIPSGQCFRISSNSFCN